jgi:glycosyltransferase involved in cell wall biosynthesis
MTSYYSVVIPAFNAAQTLAAAIDSVLAQTVLPSRVIVVDDGSTDRTEEIAREYGPPITVVQQGHLGPGSATTRGLEAMTTPLFACLDADDIWLEDKASRQLAHLQRYPDVDAVFGQVRLFHHNELPRADAPVRDNWGRSTMMMRQSAARRIGPIIDPAGGCGDMVDWLKRARELNVKLEMMGEVLALRRIMPGSLSYGRSARDEGYLHVVKLALERKRKPN